MIYVYKFLYIKIYVHNLIYLQKMILKNQANLVNLKYSKLDLELYKRIYYAICMIYKLNYLNIFVFE